MKVYVCNILSLSAHSTSESDGDELYMKIDKKRIWPAGQRFAKVKPASDIKVGFAFTPDKLGKRVEIELWEYDNFLISQQLGKFSLLLDGTGGPFTTDLIVQSVKTRARYSLIWDITTNFRAA
jgi:hypothetical protein